MYSLPHYTLICYMYVLLTFYHILLIVLKHWRRANHKVIDNVYKFTTLHFNMLHVCSLNFLPYTADRVEALEKSKSQGNR